MSGSLPDPFLVNRCVLTDLAPPAHGYCAAYEDGEWRVTQFASHLIEWLPDFVLSRRELLNISPGNMVQRLREAARSVYSTEKYERRGEFGELILHALLRQFFETTAIVKKLYFKDSANNTVKGFDAVHISGTPEDLTLWLGEAKFYQNLTDGVRDALDSIENHLDADFLRSEFTVILRQLDEEYEGADRLAELLHRNRPLDEIFTHITIPVMVTYDSVTVSGHDEVSEAYKEEFREEIAAAQAFLGERGLHERVGIVGLFVPLESKVRLVRELDNRLKRAQEV